MKDGMHLIDCPHSVLISSLDTSALSLVGGDSTLASDLAQAVLRAGVFAGEYYNATDDDGRIVGFALWMPPGDDLFST